MHIYIYNRERDLYDYTIIRLYDYTIIRLYYYTTTLLYYYTIRILYYYTLYYYTNTFVASILNGIETAST